MWKQGCLIHCGILWDTVSTVRATAEIFQDGLKTATVQPSIDLFIVVIVKPVFDLTNSAEQKLAVANIMSNGTLNVREHFTVM